MKARRTMGLFAAVLMMGIPCKQADAAMPVVDTAAIAQLVTQIRTLQSQLSIATSHLTQARDEYRSITGSRGMDGLLQGEPRNYLPADWAEMQRLLQGVSASHAALSAALQSAIAANQVLSATELSTLSPDARGSVEEARRSAAMQQVLAREALATTSARFEALQGLVAAIPAATDQKAALELQARIGAELGMLQNEQTKLDVLQQAAQAEERARRQRLREQAIADIGSLRQLPALGL